MPHFVVLERNDPMNEPVNRALLPAGLRDILPPDAEHEADVVGRLLGLFAAHGYERVKPPLIEFEDSLLSGPGAVMAGQTFRLMDPVSQQMMGLRADMTPQIARIAATRLANAPRPLRLSYAGQVLRVKGSQMRPERQFGQAGLELIGSDSPAADAEVILQVAEALQALGVEDVSLDLALPRLVGILVEALDLRCTPELREALDHKDTAKVAALGGDAADMLLGLIACTGPAERVLQVLTGLHLPHPARAEIERLAEVVALVRARAPGLALTVDPVESRGFDYQAGIAFTAFSRRTAAELGRGGRYVTGGGEAAVGATLFMDTVLGVANRPAPVRRVFVPLGSDHVFAARLRAQGWVTVAGLVQVGDDRAEARRLGCGHLVAAGELVSAD